METANFGTLLKEEREKRNVSLAEVSRATKLSVSSLQLMEAGNLDDLPPDVFVRGFVRSYARTLGISSNEPLELLDRTLLERHRAAEPMVVASFRVSPRPTAAGLARAQGHEPVAIPEPPVEDESQSPSRGIGLAVFVIIVLLIATITLSLFLRQQPQSGEALSLVDAPSESAAPAHRT
jgi:cytoskeletal protein RodZ